MELLDLLKDCLLIIANTLETPSMRYTLFTDNVYFDI